MRQHLRRYTVVAVAAGMVAGGVAVTMSGSTPAWQPVTSGLSATPEQLLPTTVSPTEPARVVTTTLDQQGRPVVSVATAGDRQSAAALIKKGQQARNAVGVEVDAPISALGVPAGDDPLSTQQWDLSKIRVPAAWETSTGSGVTVAVLDTGVDATHPDLAGQVLPGIDLVTDDAPDGTDPNGHGTHVAGTIAALTGNGVGVSAIAPDAKILPVRVLDANGSGFMSAAASGIIWATENGAKVINMSFGSATRTIAVTNAIEYARSEGVTVVAAAGNDRARGNPVSYPAAEPGVIGVAATDFNDQVAAYSSQGSFVDVAAPGSSILSTVPGDEYAAMHGTSMAAPHVSAVAALIASSHPDMDVDALEWAIESSAVDKGAKGRDKDYGAGRIDAVAALAASDVLTGTPAPSASATSSPAPSVSPSAGTSPTVTPTTSKPPVKGKAAISGGGKATVVFGQPATSTFAITIGGKRWADAPAELCIALPGTAFQCTDTTADANGKVILTRPATGAYQVMVAVAETETNTAASSPVFSVTVKSKLTVSRTGTIVTIKLVGAAGQAVQIQRLDSRKGWLLATAYRAEETHQWDGMVKGLRYRVVVPDTSSVVGTASAVFGS